MFKKTIAALLALFSTTLLSANAPIPPGSSIVSEAETSYELGEYDTFLTQLDEQYQRAGKAGILRGLFESAKSTVLTDDALDALEAKKARLASLKKERDQRLLDAISENPDLEIVKKVDTVVFFALPVEQLQALAELQDLKYHIPQTTDGTIENKISSLETEYYIKSLLLDVVRFHNDAANHTHKKIALQLEKLEKMAIAAEESGDRTWQQKIALAKQAYKADKAYKIDLESLQNLAKGSHVPKNPIEEKVATIMMDYLEPTPQGEIAQTN